MADDKLPTAELDFRHLREVVQSKCDCRPWMGAHAMSCPISIYHATFGNRSLVLQLLDLAQRPPASPETAKWRALAQEVRTFDPTMTGGCSCKQDTFTIISDALIAAADACDELDRRCRGFEAQYDALSALRDELVKRIETLERALRGRLHMRVTDRDVQFDCSCADCETIRSVLARVAANTGDGK